MIVETLGMEASASTWLYNVTIEIVKLKFPKYYNIQSSSLVGLQPKFVYEGKVVFEWPIPRIDEPDAFIIKSHAIERDFYWFLRASGAKFILSVRDPRDALSSMISRFKESEQGWAEYLSRSISSIFTARHDTDNIIFLYEDRFFETFEAVGKVADYLKITLTSDQLATIAAKFTRENVKEIVQRLEELPADRVAADHAGRIRDARSQFTAGHVGDARSDKWRENINPALHSVVDRSFGGAAGKTSLDRTFSFGFHEALFSAVKLDGVKPYEPQRHGEGATFFLRHCWLPRGRWLILISGGFPAANDLSLFVEQGGRCAFDCPIASEEISSFQKTFVLENRNFDEHLRLFFRGLDSTMLNPVRENSVMMMATFLGHI
jgi:hypothetical protein